MNLLSKLTPAETLLLTQPLYASAEILLRYTLFELMLRGVLDVRRERFHSHPNDPVGKGNFGINYVYPGKNFHTYDSNRLEKLFMPKDLSRMILRSLIYRVVRETRMIGTKNLIVTSYNLNSILRQSFLEMPFGMYRLNREGKIIKKIVKKELKALEEKIQRELAGNPVEAIGTLAAVGGNLLLVNKLPMNLLKNINQEIFDTYCKENPDFDPTYFQWKYWKSYPILRKYFNKIYPAIIDQIRREEI